MMKQLISLILAVSMVMVMMPTTAIAMGNGRSLGASDLDQPASKSLSLAQDNKDQKIEFMLFSNDPEKRAELAAGLSSLGYAPENIIFHDPKDRVDTDSLAGWYVYDHYYDPAWTSTPPADYNDQNGRVPFFAYKEYITGSSGFFPELDQTSLATCVDRPRHIWPSNGGKDMQFVGYSSPAFTDFALYPSDSTSAKLVEFDIAADVVDTHTLEGAGFLVNSKVDKVGILSGYLLYYKFNSSTSGTVSLSKIQEGTKASDVHDMGTMLRYLEPPLASEPFQISPTTKKMHVKIEASPDSIKTTQTHYKTEDELDTPTVLFAETKDGNVPVADAKNYGFGPLVGYTSHACSSLSRFTYTNISMGIKTTPGNSIKDIVWNDEDSIKIIITDNNDDEDPEEKIEDDILGNIILDNVIIINPIEPGGTPAPPYVPVISIPIGISQIPGLIDDLKPGYTVAPEDGPYKPGGTMTAVITPAVTADEVALLDVADGKPVGTVDSVKDNGDGTSTATITLPGKASDTTGDNLLIKAGNLSKTTGHGYAYITTDPNAMPIAAAFLAGMEAFAGNRIVVEDLEDGSVDLNLINNSYDPNGGSVTKAEKIIKPTGGVVVGGSITIDENSEPGEYRFVAEVTNEVGTATVTKKVKVANGNSIIPDSTYVVDGTVTDEDALPVSGAKVTLKSGNTTIGSTVTNSDGYYEISGVLDGDYRLEVTNNGTSVKKDVTVDGADLTVNIQFIGTQPEGTYTVDGTVVDEQNKPVGGASVELRQGATTVGKPTTTDATGHFAIRGVPNGTYNLVVSKNGIVVTSLVTVQGADTTLKAAIVLPSYNISSVVEVKPGLPKIVVGDMDALAAKVSANPADQAILNNGGSVEVRLIAEAATRVTEQERIQSAALADGNSALAFLELTVQKSVWDRYGNMIEAQTMLLTELPVTIRVILPLEEELQGKSNYLVYRIHSTQVDRITSTPNAFGEKLSVNSGATQLELDLNRFSTYAIAVQNGPPTSPSGGSDNSSDNDEFNKRLEEKLQNAKPGDTITLPAHGADSITESVMEILRKNENVTLVIQFPDGTSLTIHSGKAPAAEAGRFSWPFTLLRGKGAEQAAAYVNPVTGGDGLDDMVSRKPVVTAYAVIGTIEEALPQTIADIGNTIAQIEETVSKGISENIMATAVLLIAAFACSQLSFCGEDSQDEESEII